MYKIFTCSKFIGLVLLICLLGEGAFVLNAANSKPWLIALDVEKGISYFDDNGVQLSRAHVVSQVDVNAYSGIEFGDFDKRNNWFEVILLRKDFWFDLYPLPKPGEKSIKRIDYFRFSPAVGCEATSVSYVNYPKDQTQFSMLVEGVRTLDKKLDRLLFFELLNIEDRKQVKVLSFDLNWDVLGSPVEVATLGYNCNPHTIALITNDSLHVAKVTPAGSQLNEVLTTELPKDIVVQQLKFQGNKIYLLDDQNQVHLWALIDNKLRPLSEPVRLDSPYKIKAIALLGR